MSAATRLRRLLPQADIVVLERSGYVSFANCGLPYYIGGVIEDRSALLLQTPQALAKRFGLDVRVHHEVTHIDPQRRCVQARTPDGSVASVEYDALVLSPGATPVRPPIPGIERALMLRDIEDTDALARACAGAQNAVVIGGGFIGVELAENLVHAGIDVALIESAPQVMTPLDPEMAAPVHERLRERGVELRLASAVSEVRERSVVLNDGTHLAADLVVAAVGVRPDVALAHLAGLRIGERGGILVDDYGRTSDPAIYAVGDAVEKRDLEDGSAVLVPLANTANLQGRRVADVIAGRPRPVRPVQATAIIGVFGLQVATTGWSERRLRAAGRAYRAIHTHPLNHAGYYPGAITLTLKVLIDPATDLILGAQAVGEDGVDKRIDVIATAMRAGLTASELADLELAYAPQFGSAKDPVNMVGYVAENLASGLTQSIQWHELAAAQADGALLIDVRSAAEHARGAIPDALLLPVDELRERLSLVDSDDVIVQCAVGVRGHVAAMALSRPGRRVRNLDGGYRTWAAGMAAMAETDQSHPEFARLRADSWSLAVSSS